MQEKLMFGILGISPQKYLKQYVRRIAKNSLTYCIGLFLMYSHPSCLRVWWKAKVMTRHWPPSENSRVQCMYPELYFPYVFLFFNKLRIVFFFITNSVSHLCTNKMGREAVNSRSTEAETTARTSRVLTPDYSVLDDTFILVTYHKPCFLYVRIRLRMKTGNRLSIR